MEKVTGFVTKDNKFFKTEREAEQHERSLDFLNWYKKLPPAEKLRQTGTSCKDWLLKNRDAVERLYGTDLATVYNCN